MKLRKVLALALAATMTLSLAACGGSTETAETPATETKEHKYPCKYIVNNFTLGLLKKYHIKFSSDYM